MRQKVDFVRKRERHVPGGDVERVGALPFVPLGLREQLVLGKLWVPVQRALKAHRSALVAVGLEAAERGGETDRQVVYDLLLA